MTTPRGHTSGNGGESPSLLEYLHVLSRRKTVFIATCLLVPIVAVVLSLRQQPVYESSADVLLTPPSAGVLEESCKGLWTRHALRRPRCSLRGSPMFWTGRWTKWTGRT